MLGSPEGMLGGLWRVQRGGGSGRVRHSACTGGGKIDHGSVHRILICVGRTLGPKWPSLTLQTALATTGLWVEPQKSTNMCT
jgi:hypothetical protein